ncbi:uncharacterized protein BO72DRAFT_494334 [Aspergillus fijiensis CBS 313.89]|uniref:Uncharacterized protein n=1 Tax=Aspergillus fijiensis CBS 313.89 TaxID=1448319 RepID=A0A8G1RSN6_9EURO|nr:uncharacterized protein BO72DRAFT_494334 [Aspergillus fijiensis CBS 313.89]RAK79477.1 hypothetical protein BO72DRAFT_494334 [Aspergillus fijiensis CBS 313.89]
MPRNGTCVMNQMLAESKPVEELGDETAPAHPTGPFKLLGEDLIVNQMRRLIQLLDNWVKVNFKDVAKIPPESLETDGQLNAPQRRALVHATVANLIHAEIFGPYHF